ncbi:amidase family protein [Paracraurococcus lichenis]|uniref:Amidase family protein n=1 Tax=Paracraurococcus lichenis TaxID=3064888 RepID=A0ABT9DXP6_9PROT|nr:amidase family protein [Paracraurococcus sp. LOR1-02]MDO9708677.1 amidase family protein [Paracraurococcus sp. LOR1-02]
MPTTDLATASATELAALVRARQASPVEVTEAVLARIAAWEGRLNAFVALDAERARAAAQAAEAAVMRGDPLGPLHGVPVTIKDMQAVAGLPTRRGSRLSDATPATADAPLVARLRAAGAVILGKTTSTEQGWTAVSHNPLTGATHNPWQHGMTSGGSSSGAAALCGAGCGPLHLGTDGAGSIRLPAHFCGAVGFKPTYGRVPYAPVPNNGALSHAGPITRSVADAALMFSVMAGPHPLDHTTLGETFPGGVPTDGLRGLRIAYSPDLGHAKVDPEVAALVADAVRALEAAGAVVEQVTPPWGPTGPALEREIWGAAMRPFLPRDAAEAAQMDPGLVACTEAYRDFGFLQGHAAQGRRFAYAAAVNSWFEEAGFDLLATPAASVAAFPVGLQRPPHWEQHAWDWLVWAEFSYPFNLSHGPAVALPCGRTAAGLPVGLQLAGPRLADSLVLRAAAGFLEARPFAPGFSSL